MVRAFSDEEFYELYNQGLNDALIAKELDVSQATIHYYRMRNNIPANIFNRYKFDRNVFLRYYEEGLNDLEIAERMQANPKAICAYRNKLHLPVNFKNDFIQLTDFQMSSMLGGVLGDSYLKKSGNRASGSFAHSLHQENYFRFKYQIWEDFCGKISYGEQTHKKTGKAYSCIYTHFSSCQSLFPLWDCFYKEGKKAIYNKEFFDSYFSNSSIAIWFGDDGYKMKDSYCFSTNAFNTETMRILMKKLNDYGIETTIHRSNNNLYILKESSPVLTEIVYSILPESMHYKLHL